MADQMLFQGGTTPTGPARKIPGTDEPTLADHEMPPGVTPARDPLSDADRPEDWKDPSSDEDMPPADEPTPLSDDRR